MIRKARFPLFIAPLALAVAIPAFTQTSTTPDNPAPGAKKPRVVIIHHADRSVYQGSLRVLEGRVHLQEGETHFWADRITYDEEAKKGEAVRDPAIKGGSIGNPRAEDVLNTLTADRINLDFSPKEARLKVVSAVGNVKFVAKPKKEKEPKKEADPKTEKAPEPKRDRLQDKVKEETVLTCNRLDYYYRTKKAVASDGLKVTQGKRWLTGDQAIYFDRYDTVVVNGNVKGEDEKGRTFEANSLKIVTSGPTDTIEANTFHGTFTLDEEEESVEEKTEDTPPSLDGGVTPPVNPSTPGG